MAQVLKTLALAPVAAALIGGFLEVAAGEHGVSRSIAEFGVDARAFGPSR